MNLSWMMKQNFLMHAIFFVYVSIPHFVIYRQTVVFFLKKSSKKVSLIIIASYSATYATLSNFKNTTNYTFNFLNTNKIWKAPIHHQFANLEIGITLLHTSLEISPKVHNLWNKVSNDDILLLTHRKSTRRKILIESYPINMNDALNLHTYAEYML